MKKLVSILLAFVLCFGLFTACGNGEPAGEEADSDVIKIGVVLPFSGASSYVGIAQYEGIEYALQDFVENHGDRLNGKTIELVTGDSTGVPDTGVTEFERLVNQENVTAIIGPYNSGVGAALAPLAIKYQTPFMVTNAVADSILAEDSKYIYRSNQGDKDSERTFGQFIQFMIGEGAPIEKVAIVYEATDFGIGAHDAMANVFAAEGLEVVLDESVAANSGDLSTVINKIKASGADFVGVVLMEADALLFTRQMEEYGVDIPYYGYGGGFTTDNYVVQSGEMCELGLAGASYFYDEGLMSEDALAIAADFVANTEYTTVVEPFANGYLGMYCLLEGIANAGATTDKEAIADALDVLDIKPGHRALLFHPTLEGVKYVDDNGRYNQNQFAGQVYGQIHDGTYKLIFPATDATAPFVWTGK